MTDKSLKILLLALIMPFVLLAQIDKEKSQIVSEDDDKNSNFTTL